MGEESGGVGGRVVGGPRADEAGLEEVAAEAVEEDLVGEALLIVVAVVVVLGGRYALRRGAPEVEDKGPPGDGSEQGRAVG